MKIANQLKIILNVLRCINIIVNNFNMMRYTKKVKLIKKRKKEIQINFTMSVLKMLALAQWFRYIYICIINTFLLSLRV